MPPLQDYAAKITMLEYFEREFLELVSLSFGMFLGKKSDSAASTWIRSLHAGILIVYYTVICVYIYIWCYNLNDNITII